MKNTDTLTINWHDWLQRWDRQQTAYLPNREQRFEAMLDVLDILLPPNFVAIDLACGPGSISQRLLTRFPQARSIAVDLDPVLLALGQNTLGDMQGRLRWVEADLRDAAWLTQLEVQHVDAVLSTTALHWLPADTLIRLYSQLGQLIRPSGVFLNGDHLAFGPHAPTFQKIAQALNERASSQAFTREGVEDWRTWWDALGREPAMHDLFAERARRFAWRHPDETDLTLELHEAALRHAGFHEAATIWQNADNRVVMAIR